MLNSWIPRVVALVVLSVSFTPDVAFGRIRLLERNGRAILYPRRFDQQNPQVIGQISAACPSGFGICATLSGQAIDALLANAPQCSQQDVADDLIDASKQFGSQIQTNIISLAVEYRKAEKNTPPDFTHQPPIQRNSVFCQKCPRNPELNGLVQAQDPENNKTAFFDPALQKTVIKGSQPNTEPFKGPCPTSSSNKTATTDSKLTTTNKTATTGSKDATTNKTVNVCKPNKKSSTSSSPLPSSTPLKNDTSLLSSNSSGADFGSCSKPEIKFAGGLDRRKETAFAPSDPKSYPHGSADNINVITSFICLAMVNTCNANQPAKDLCSKAQAAASSATPALTGAQADAFNAVFGINTDFKSVTPISNTGQPLTQSK